MQYEGATQWFLLYTKLCTMNRKNRKKEKTVAKNIHLQRDNCFLSTPFYFRLKDVDKIIRFHSGKWFFNYCHDLFAYLKTIIW